MTQSKRKVLVNCDVGEGYGGYPCGPDQLLLPLIDMANVACGFHAGDPLVMARTVALCKMHKIRVGALVGLPDVAGFGQREMKLTSEEHTANIVYQIGALQAFLERENMTLHHVKPHGALYDIMTRDIEVARAVWAGVPRGCRVLGRVGTVMEFAALEAGVDFWAEYYGDVDCRRDGSLKTTKYRPACVRATGVEVTGIDRPRDDVRERIRQQLYEGCLMADNGQYVALPVKNYPISVCCHSDMPGHLEAMRAMRAIVDEFNVARAL